MFDIKNYKTFFIEQNTQNAQIFTSFVNRNDSYTKSLLREERKFLIVLNIH